MSVNCEDDFWYIWESVGLYFSHDFEFIAHTPSDELVNFDSDFRLRPYHVEYTGSRPITEVNLRRAWLVLGWETAWEYQVP